MTTLQLNTLKNEPTIDVKDSVVDFLYPMIEEALNNGSEWDQGIKFLIDTEETFNALHGYTFNQQNKLTTKLYQQHYGYKHNGFVSQSSFSKLYKEHQIILIKGTKLCPIWFSSIVFTKAAKNLLVKYGYKRSDYPSKVDQATKTKMKIELDAINETMIYRFQKLSYVANVESFNNLLGTDNEKILKVNKNSTTDDWKLQLMEQLDNSTEEQDQNFINSLMVNMDSKPEIKFHHAVTAYYRPSADTVNVRTSNNMTSEESFLETVLHELIHSTNHETRTNRRSRTNYTEKHGRSLEECVAEIGMIYSLKRFDDSAINKNKIYENAGVYLGSWLSMLPSKKQKVERLLTAAKYADQAERYIFEPTLIELVNKPIDKQNN